LEVAITGLGAMLMRFPGQYADDETGVSYNYFRDCDPGITVTFYQLSRHRIHTSVIHQSSKLGFSNRD